MSIFSTLLLFDLACTETLRDSQAYKMMTMSFMVLKWLNHEWMHTHDANIEPLDEERFKLFAPVGGLIPNSIIS